MIVGWLRKQLDDQKCKCPKPDSVVSSSGCDAVDYANVMGVGLKDCPLSSDTYDLLAEQVSDGLKDVNTRSAVATELGISSVDDVDELKKVLTRRCGTFHDAKRYNQHMLCENGGGIDDDVFVTSLGCNYGAQSLCIMNSARGFDRLLEKSHQTAARPKEKKVVEQTPRFEKCHTMTTADECDGAQLKIDENIEWEDGKRDHSVNLCCTLGR